jgi:hypothetical protein
VGTADDPGTFITHYEYPTSLAGRNFERFTLTNDPAATERFTSLDFAFMKRLSGRWQLLASFSATKRNVPVLVGPTGSEFDSNVMAGPRDPNAEINTSDQNWEWLGKVSGLYRFPYQIMGSANYEHRGGYPWAREVLFTGGAGLSRESC